MRLIDLCHFQTGFTARRRLEPSFGDGQLALQLRDLREDGSIDMQGLQRFDLGLLPARYAVKPGDVVFRSRGQSTIAYLVPEVMTEPVVALLPLIILRPRPEIVTPEYLVWVINQPGAQRQIDAEAQGTSLRMIPKTSLEGILVPVPDLGTQRLVVEVARLSARETSLLRDLADITKIHTSQVLASLVQTGAKLKGAHQ
ncbi:hypothetical protein ACQKOE_12700 [Novosphingobium sp. NPDC080210]|jgi:hypothetical protein|uniref:hypothetical protein n=1 Tax=Novosphingobium sp. NPDC080210 TaxID=3390596 RepID=UPI003CFD4E91